MSILSKNNDDYFRLLHHYRQNRGEKLTSWLDFGEIFGKQGKQGIVGSLSYGAAEGESENKYVFKLSQYINYMAKHEALVMKGLNSLHAYCPNFCRSYGIVGCEVDPKIKKRGNPFEIEDKYPIDKDVLLIEHIPGYKFLTYIKSKQIGDDIIYSIIKQVLLAVIIAQRDKKFSHYDLHSNNIILRKCPEETVLVYVIDGENQFCVPTYGYIAVIIDFGFSYVDDMRDEPFWNTLAHTDVGFMIDRFDWVSDPKLFLVSVCEDLRLYRKNKNSKKLRVMTKNIFSGLDIDWESGWDSREDGSAADQVLRIIEKFNSCSDVFRNFDHFAIDLLQSLIILPMEPQKCKNVHRSYQTFLREFHKIEEDLNSDFYSLYILKKIIDSARDLRPSYLKCETREEGSRVADRFKNEILGEIYRVARFCHPKGVNYEYMLCSLLLLGRSIEGLLYNLMYLREAEKEEEHEKLPVKSAMDIFASIEIEFPSEYKFTEETAIIVLDSLEKNTKETSLSVEETEEINKKHPSSRGVFIYTLRV